MKVVIVSAGFEPRYLPLQPHRTLLEMGRQLVVLGHEAVLISDGASHLPALDRVAGLPLRRVQSTSLLRGWPNPSLLQVIDQVSPDILLWHLGLNSFVHQNLHHNFAQHTIGILTSPVHRPMEILRLGPKKLSLCLELVLAHLMASWVPGSLVRDAFARRGLRGVITWSETTRQHLLKKGAPAGRVWVVPPGVDSAWLHTCLSAEERQNLRRRLGFGNGNFVATYFGSLSPERGLYTTLLAMKQATRSCPQLRLLILSRRWADECRRQTTNLNYFIERNGLQDRVRVVDGFLQPLELMQYIIASDVVCLPFELVPSDVPLSILEAMALKQGVITTKVSSIPELVGNDRGFLISPASASSLAEQLYAIAEAPSMASERGQRARAYVEAFRTLSHMGQVLQQVLTTAPSG